MIDNYSVYVHRFPNDKYYVGITRQDVEQRWGYNGSGYKKQPVYSAILTYGWDSIDHMVVATDLSAEEAQQMESDLIEQFDSINNGYNVAAAGGLGGDERCEFEYNGIIYSAKELAEMSPYDISYHDITTRINHHKWSVDKAINTPKTEKNITFLYNGINYTIKQLYEIRKNKTLTLAQIRNRLLKHDWDVDRAITQPPNKKLQPHGVGTCEFEYNGKYYNSWELCQISSVPDLKPQDITDRVNRRHWSVERAITQPKRKR